MGHSGPPGRGSEPPTVSPIRVSSPCHPMMFFSGPAGWGSTPWAHLELLRFFVFAPDLCLQVLSLLCQINLTLHQFSVQMSLPLWIFFPLPTLGLPDSVPSAPSSYFSTELNQLWSVEQLGATAWFCVIYELRIVFIFLNTWRENIKRRVIFCDTWKLNGMHISVDINKVLLV